MASTCFEERYRDDNDNNNRRFVITEVAQVPRSGEGSARDDATKRARPIIRENVG